MDIQTVAIGFAVMLALLLFSLPVAAVMTITGVVGGALLYGLPLVDSMGSVIWGVLNDNVMTAVPLFILLGEILLRSGIADRMYEALSLWLGRLPGGLLHSNIGASALFAATSGSSVAAAATISTVSLPALTNRGYPVRRSLGSLAAGGTLGILIPPSVNLLIYGSLAGESVGRLFVAGIVPGILLTSLFSLYILVEAKLFPGHEREMSQISWSDRFQSLRYLVGPLLIFMIITGSIYTGFATPTESAALGVVGALMIVIVRGRMSLDFLGQCFVNTARTSGMILLIITGAFMLNVTLSLGGVAQAATDWVASLGLSAVGLLIALIAFYIILGMFMDVLSMMVLTIPVALPIIKAAGIDPIWFGIFIILMCELGLITPPVGMNLYVVHGVRADNGPFRDVALGALPYVVLMIVFALILIVFPGLVTWLPNQMHS
ncbi:tripartite ATP-independent transporter DctM subunit [Breoghania corrubedonensis]|uniref:TRAP transporter large permease protein n=1 Tax=Breoghania corrubedonensis TaxID=665038 RepID=A0A2T5V6E5_9HYPH|nr:TRAP transporter large permease [Breoghania corrubedonensis]PTW59314.1 tripartite ATP-independent transporter DctM subunit [Breoghania corrubedonensis]